MKTKLTFFLALTFLFLFSGSSVVFAGDFQDAFDAYKRQDYKTAYRLWLPFAEQGDADAQYNLGVMCYKGLGVLQDDKEAFKWFRLAAEQGYDRAQHYVGFMYDLGKGGVPQDDKEAIKWYRLAAAQGHVSAQNKIKQKLEEQRMAEEQRLVEEQREEETVVEKVNLWETEENEVEKNLKKLKTENSCPYCDLGKTNLTDANLVEANLKGAQLGKANLSGANLSGANLFGAGLDEANLTGANLTGANLTGADVAGANLTGANLTNANLTGLRQSLKWTSPQHTVVGGKTTTWTGANLSGAKLDPPEPKYHHSTLGWIYTPGGNALNELHSLKKSSLARQQFAEKKQKEVKKKQKENERMIQCVRKKSIEECVERMVEQQKEFITIVSSASKDYRSAKNDIKKSIVRKKRKEKLKRLLGGYAQITGPVTDFDEIQEIEMQCQQSVYNSCVAIANIFETMCDPLALVQEIRKCVSKETKNGKTIRSGFVVKESREWIGTLKSISTDKDGDASVHIKLTNNIALLISEINPNDPIYEPLGDLEERGKVYFSGKFKTHDDLMTRGYYLSTTNMTEQGALRNPTFSFDLRGIEPIE